MASRTRARVLPADCDLEFSSVEMVPTIPTMRPGEVPRDRRFVGTASMVDLVFSAPALFVFQFAAQGVPKSFRGKLTIA